MQRSLVLYDGDCGFCKWLLACPLTWDRAQRLQPVALQTVEAAELLADMSEERRFASWHLIAPTGERYSAGAALAPMLRQLPGGSLPAAAFARAPDLTERVYGWVAEHRSSLSRWTPSSWKRRGAKVVAARETTPD